MDDFSPDQLLNLISNGATLKDMELVVCSPFADKRVSLYIIDNLEFLLGTAVSSGLLARTLNHEEIKKLVLDDGDYLTPSKKLELLQASDIDIVDMLIATPDFTKNFHRSAHLEGLEEETLISFIIKAVELIECSTVYSEKELSYYALALISAIYALEFREPVLQLEDQERISHIAKHDTLFKISRAARKSNPEQYLYALTTRLMSLIRDTEAYSELFSSLPVEHTEKYFKSICRSTDYRLILDAITLIYEPKIEIEKKCSKYYLEESLSFMIGELEKNGNMTVDTVKIIRKLLNLSKTHYFSPYYLEKLLMLANIDFRKNEDLELVRGVLTTSPHLNDSFWNYSCRQILKERLSPFSKGAAPIILPDEFLRGSDCIDTERQRYMLFYSFMSLNLFPSPSFVEGLIRDNLYNQILKGGLTYSDKSNIFYMSLLLTTVMKTSSEVYSMDIKVKATLCGLFNKDSFLTVIKENNAISEEGLISIVEKAGEHLGISLSSLPLDYAEKLLKVRIEEQHAGRN